MNQVKNELQVVILFVIFRIVKTQKSEQLILDRKLVFNLHQTGL